MTMLQILTALSPLLAFLPVALACAVWWLGPAQCVMPVRVRRWKAR